MFKWEPLFLKLDVTIVVKWRQILGVARTALFTTRNYIKVIRVWSARLIEMNAVQ